MHIGVVDCNYVFNVCSLECVYACVGMRICMFMWTSEGGCVAVFVYAYECMWVILYVCVYMRVNMVVCVCLVSV